jgi:PhnB protein
MAKKAAQKVPAGMHTLTPNLFFNGNCKEALEFYKKAFNAEVQGKIFYSPDGKTVWHAMLKIGDSNIMCADAMEGSPNQAPKDTTTVSLMIYVEDCDAWFKRAIDAGGEVIMEMEDMFWGDRMGNFKDPFGHTWNIGSAIWEYTPEEMKKNQDEFVSRTKQHQH